MVNGPPSRRNRVTVDLIADVLKAAGDGARKTRIMYGANLSYSYLTKYLNGLTAIGLLESKSPVFRWTENGQRWLSAYSEMKKHIRAAEEKKELLLRQIDPLTREKQVAALEKRDVLSRGFQTSSGEGL